MSAMAEKQLIMLKLVDQTPVLAGCSGCNLKFFVPKGLMKDPFQANNYLLSKFDRHVCTGEDPPPKKRIDKLGGCKFKRENDATHATPVGSIGPARAVARSCEQA